MILRWLARHPARGRHSVDNLDDSGILNRLQALGPPPAAPPQTVTPVSIPGAGQPMGSGMAVASSPKNPSSLVPLGGATPAQPSPHAAEYSRLTAPPLSALPAGDPNRAMAHTSADTGESGIGQIKSPWARIPLQVLEGIGSMFGPTRSLEMALPGTQAHHNVLVRQAAGAENEDTAETAGIDKSRLENAQAAEAESLPQLHKTQAELAAEKLTSANTNKDKDRAIKQADETRKESQGNSREAVTLAQHGYKRDEGGAIVPLPYEEMSQEQQGVHDLKASQQELADARAALVKAQKDNIPVAQKLAQQRLESATQAHGIALQRLGLSEKQFEMRAHGTEGGEALPGAMLDDQNKPVGTAFQQNVRPTGQERNKADLANSAHSQLQDIKSIVSRRPDIFGPAAGRKTDFTVWLGSQDPDAQRFRAARTIAGDHLAGVFGGRSEAALQALDSAIGHFKDNPAALQAGLDQLDKANAGFQKAGTVKTAGSNAAEAGAEHKVGDTKKFPNGKSGKWDGTGWVAQ